MNKRERADIVKVLTFAKSNLWDGKGYVSDKPTYICYALGDVECTSPKYEKVVCYIRELIEFRLCGNNSLEKWLKVYIGIPVDQITPQRMQAHRHAWLDMLIEEFSK